MSDTYFRITQTFLDGKAMRGFIDELLGETEPKAIEAWIQYATELDQEGTENAFDFYRNFCGELEYIKNKAGVEIARRLFDMGQAFTLNPFELRTAALLLLSGTPEGEISRLAVEDDLFDMMRRETGSFPNPLPKAAPPSAVGRVSFASGGTREYTDALEYVKAVRKEQSYANSTGFHCETLTENPLVRKALDDILSDFYAEENLRTPEDHRNTPSFMETGDMT